jgi:hypothetical protein
LSIQAPPELDEDLDTVAALPGDICPDNNLITSDGIRFIDFESADFHCRIIEGTFPEVASDEMWLPGVRRAPAIAHLPAAAAGR